MISLSKSENGLLGHPVAWQMANRQGKTGLPDLRARMLIERASVFILFYLLSRITKHDLKCVSNHHWALPVNKHRRPSAAHSGAYHTNMQGFL